MYSNFTKDEDFSAYSSRDDPTKMVPVWSQFMAKHGSQKPVLILQFIRERPMLPLSWHNEVK